MSDGRYDDDDNEGYVTTTIQWSNGKDQDIAPDNVVPFPKSINDPVDLWAQFPAPDLPHGVLPKLIEQFAFDQGQLMGADPAGLAMGALTVCAAAIPDSLKLQVKKNDPHWKESARLWTALIGPVSTLKSPIIYNVSRAATQINTQLFEKYIAARKAYEATDKKERGEEPIPERLKLEDVTPDAAQEIFRHNPEGLLLLREELSGWFGAMEKYTSGKGGAADRGFWLSAYNGQAYSYDRVGRGSHQIKNMGVCVLGGIQPSAMQVIADAVVDLDFGLYETGGGNGGVVVCRDVAGHDGVGRRGIEERRVGSRGVELPRADRGHRGCASR